MDIFKFGDEILVLLNLVFSFWNHQMGLVYSMLGQTPDTFKGGSAWSAIEAVNPLFVGVGSSLVVLFFVIGFCAESVDIREEMRFEVILKMMIRVGLSEWLVANNIPIMKAFFAVVGNIVNSMTSGSVQELVLDSAQEDVIRDLGFGESLVMLILALLLSAIILICGFFITYTVYFRFLKLLVLIPMGSIAFATVGGSRTVSASAGTFAKYFLSVAFEAVTMALAIIACNAFISAGLPDFADSYSGWAKTLLYLCEMTFTSAMTVGFVKGAQNLTSRIFGL